MTAKKSGQMGPTMNIRRWPVFLIVGMYAVGLLLVLIRDFPSRQAQVFATIGVTILFFLLLLLWLLFFSRLTLRIRGITAGVLVLCLIVGALLFRIRGVSGDFLPILEWRWSAESWTQEITGNGSNLTTSMFLVEAPGDYPQFLGPGRNAVLSGYELQTDWENHPPREIWRIPVGMGWSAFAVKGSFAITQEQRGEAHPWHWHCRPSRRLSPVRIS